MDYKESSAGSSKPSSSRLETENEKPLVKRANIGISEKNLEAVALMLNTLLADEHVLYIKTRNYHWNVKGIHFRELHKFFESQYKELEKAIDEIAERVRYLGHYAIGSLNDFKSLARLLENKQQDLNQEQMLLALLEDHEAIIRILREDLVKVEENYKDAGTCDFLTGLMKKHEEKAWMLRSHLSGL
jgi:starvation-inducible DNA-binding protein